MKHFLLSVLLIIQMCAPAHVLAGSQKILTADIVEGVKTSKNYLKTKGHFEKNANGWSGYDDGAVTRPVDGTGGATITTTCTRSTTTPMSGDGSLIMTKGAANYQGEGCSVDFTVDEKDQAKVLQVEFDYIVSSGTFTAGTSTTDSDVIAYLYDVTNGVLIEPSTFKLYSSSTTISDKFIGNFQTASNSKSYRLMLHIASSANTSSMVVKFDDFKVSPSNYVYGTPITDWQSYTPTGAWSTNTTYTGQWRRVGDSVEVKNNIALAGAPTSATLTVNLPSGLTIDTAKIPGFANQYTPLGVVTFNDAGVDVYQGIVTYSSTTAVGINSVITTSGSNPQKIDYVATTQANPFTFGASDKLTFTYSVPIVGWSSSVQQSDGYDGRLIAAKYTTTGGVTSWSSAQVVKYTTLVFDKTNSYSTSTGLFTCPSAGIYRVTAQFYGITNFSYVYLGKNGTEVGRIMQAVASGTPGSLLIECNAGDTLGIYNAAATVSSVDGANYNSVSFEKLSSPTTISATETVAARYTSSAGQSIANAATPIVDFATKDYDTHGAVTTGASWKFTAPVAGIYSVNALVRYANTLAWTAGNYTSALLYKNGSSYSSSDNLIAANITPGNGPSAIMSDEVNMNAGDYIDIRTAHGESAARALVAAGTLVRISIKKIK